MAQVYGALEGQQPSPSFQHAASLTAPSEPQPRRYQRSVALLAVGAVAVVALTAKFSGEDTSVPAAAVQADAVQAPQVFAASGASANSERELESAHIYAWNEYTTFSDDGVPSKVPGVNLYTAFANNELVEPYRTTTLRCEHSFGEDAQVSWTVTRQGPTSSLRLDLGDTSDSTTLSGQTVTHMFTGAGYKYAVAATVSSADRSEVLESIGSVFNALYVRREIRQLTDADRELLLAAMWVPYSTAEDEGKRTYGENYMALESIHQMHNYWASDRTCDHLHDGYGFSTQHLALTLRYEAVLQAVNPAVVVPFWEYTMESADIYENHDGNFNAFYEVSPVFQDEWFGKFDNMKEPWRSINLTSSVSDSSMRTRTNPFGLMRSPWNFAQEKHILRYNQRCGFNTADMLSGLEYPSSCSAFADALSYTALTDFTWDLMESPHGSIHILMGGISGACDTEYKAGLSEHFDESSVAIMGAISAVALKELWRAGYVNFTSCGLDEPEACAQVCPENPVAAGRHLYQGVLYRWNLVPLNKTDEEGFLAAIGNTIGCTPLSIGDMYASSATIDPLFWLMHTTTDRLQTYKRGKSYNFTDLSWPDNKECYGHSSGDVTIFDVSVGLNLVTPANLTNMDVYELTNPTSRDYAMNYVYHDFDYSHCNFDKYPVFRRDYTPDADLPLTQVGAEVNKSVANSSVPVYIPSKVHSPQDSQSMLG